MIKTLLIVFLFFLVTSYVVQGQTQIGQDIDGETADENSGFSVSLSTDGNIVAIGSPYSGIAANVPGFGLVRVYENVSGTWIQLGNSILGQTVEDAIGNSVSLSSDGSIVAIGAQLSNTNGIDSGTVRIYENISGVWTQIGQDIDGESMNDRFGHVVKLSSDGSIIASSSYFNDGYVRIYENMAGVWTQIGNDIDEEANGDWSGYSMSLSSNGNIVAIGAPENDGINGTRSGQIRVYENISGVWTQVGSDVEGDGSNNVFGRTVSISSDGTIFATAGYLNGDSSGIVRVYENVSGTWTQVGNDMEGEAMGDLFGSELEISSDGSIIAIGTHLNDGNGIDSGHVRIYKNISGIWTQIIQDIDGEASSDQSGASISISSDASIVAIGALGNAGNGINSGHVRVYTIASELAMLEVVEDILGNANGINITASQLNSINNVSGAIEGVNYTTALGNGTFNDDNNPIAAEIQLIIDQVNASLSIMDNELFFLKLYPNPAKNQFNIQLDQSLDLKEATIYNLLGEEVLKTKEIIINTTQLSSGTYLVKIVTNKGKATKKLVIE